MTLPRLLLCLLLITAATPWLSVELLQSTSPGAVGTLTETTDKNRYFLNHSDFRYAAPATIGTPHWLTLPALLPGLQSTQRKYNSLGPTSGPLRPTLVLLHGGGRSNRSMLDMWRDLAEQKNLILIAPQSASSIGWSLWQDGRLFTGALLADAGQHHPIDPDQIYLVGHSMGAKFALRLANLGIGPWRAVSVHAGHIVSGTVLPARNPIPIHIQVGENDPIFTPIRVRATAKRLAAAGHDVSLTVIPDHTHWYYRIAPQVAPRIWQALQGIPNRPAAIGLNHQSRKTLPGRT